jgi:hypothetical protein
VAVWPEELPDFRAGYYRHNNRLHFFGIRKHHSGADSSRSGLLYYRADRHNSECEEKDASRGARRDRKSDNLIFGQSAQTIRTPAVHTYGISRCGYPYDLLGYPVQTFLVDYSNSHKDFPKSGEALGQTRASAAHNYISNEGMREV